MKQNERNMFTLQQWLNTQGLTTYEKLVYIVLFCAAGGGSECSLSVASIARLCSCSGQQVMVILNSLEAKEIISRRANYLTKRNQGANIFTLRFGA